MTSSAVKGQVKGLLKGLRYISQIFDEGEDKDIQIGFPTDVKHLAHIGCENSTANAPSWMTEFKGTPEPSSGAVNSTKMPEGKNDSNSKVDGSRHHSRRSKQHSISTENQSNSPSREQSSEGSISKHTRRHHRSSDSSESSRRHRHHGSGTEEEKPPSSSTTTKHSHRRKSKTSTSEEKEGSIRRPSRTSRRSSKDDSLTDTEIS